MKLNRNFYHCATEFYYEELETWFHGKYPNGTSLKIELLIAHTSHLG